MHASVGRSDLALGERLSKFVEVEGATALEHAT
jgi:hypothetical protein